MPDQTNSASLTIVLATVHWIWPRRGSIAGGTVVNLYGNGFATDGYVSQNLVFIGQVPCIVRQ